MDTRRVVGCMTGTSIDALDAALVETSGHGLAMSARVLRTHTAPLDALAPRLRAVADQTPTTAAQIAGLARDFSLLHTRAIRELLAGESADLACVHGQTVFHAPPLSWQLINAPVLALELRTPVVFDLRAADLAAGGQGAPITPIADWVLFHHLDCSPAIVNLGGFANCTKWISEDAREAFPIDRVLGLVRAGDICVCNQFLDSIARTRLGRPFDDGGAVALSGTVDEDAFRLLREALAAQSRSGRSLGTRDEASSWLNAHASLPTNALLRTACEAIGAVIADWLDWHGVVAVAGGGARNEALVGAIRSRVPRPVTTTDELGVPASHREAICFAVLGALCQDRVPITLPQVTRVPAPAPICGCWAFP